MSTLTASPATRSRSPQAAPAGRVTFLHLLNSEWIKLVTLRSTWWTLGSTVVVMVLFALMMAAANGFDAGPDGPPPTPGASVVTFGYIFAQVSVGVLGALIVTGEYSTGMIRSTIAAAPGRTGVMLAKASVLAVVTFVTGVVGVLLSYLATAGMLGDGVADLGDGETWRIFLGAGGYLALIALFAFALGIIIRNGAATIAAILGVTLLLTILVSILGFSLEWLGNIAPYLPAAAGAQIMTPTMDAASAAQMGFTVSPTPWEGFAILAGYVAITLGIGLTLLKKRDV